MLLSMLLASASGLLLASPAPQGACVGCPEAAEVNQDIVDFVFSELTLGDCQKQAVRVENFQSQVVAGIRYKFDLVSGENSECGLTGLGETQTCHVEVRCGDNPADIGKHCLFVFISGLQRALDGDN